MPIKDVERVVAEVSVAGVVCVDRTASVMVASDRAALFSSASR